jgi:hypothetical protein
MRRIGAFGRFWWDFIVGDDWQSAALIVVALGLTAATGAWWVLPVSVALVLGWSLYRLSGQRPKS